MSNNFLKEREERIKTDKETVELLLSHGADLGKQYLIDFFFVGENNNLEKVAEILTQQGYTHADQSKDNELHMQHHIKLDLMKSNLITESLEVIAKENGVKFDGWGTVAN